MLLHVASRQIYQLIHDEQAVLNLRRYGSTLQRHGGSGSRPLCFDQCLFHDGTVIR